ncbi:L-alanine exporter AlaE [Planktomarina temperata]|nr:L-alanine exporter AlaE [Planktomarina temperata]
MKSYFVDTAATVIFFTVVAALSELLIAGMGPTQVLIARLIMIPVMMVTARPYGLWRDWFFSKTRPQRWLPNLVGDIIAFITFQVPVYVATLALAGANASEIVAAVSASIVFMILLSRPFGIYLQAVRNWARMLSDE